MRLGLGLDLAAQRRPASAASVAWDYDLTTGVLPPVLSVSRATSGSRIAASGLVEIQAANTPRFDHDPLTHDCKGLLVEPQCTYLGIDSENHAAASWLLFGGLQRSTFVYDSPLRTSDSVSRIGNGTQSYSSINPTFYKNSTGRLFQAWIIRNFDSLDGRLVLRDNTATASFTWSINWALPGVAGSDISSLTLSSATAGLSSYSYGFFRLGGGWWCVWASGLCGAGNSINLGRFDPAQVTIGRSIDIAATWVVEDQFGYSPSYLPTTYGTAITRDADVPVISDVSRPYRITYTPLAGGAAQTQDVAAGAQPSALHGRWTRVQQL